MNICRSSRTLQTMRNEIRVCCRTGRKWCYGNRSLSLPFSLPPPLSLFLSLRRPQFLLHYCPGTSTAKTSAAPASGGFEGSNRHVDDEANEGEI